MIKRFVKDVINLILYSNLWIALAAAFMVFETQLLLTQQVWINSLVGFIFCGTLFLYAVHRIVGLNKVRLEDRKGRYLIIQTFKHHIIIYALISGVGAGILFFWLEWSVQLSLIIPSILSLAYVLPFLSGKKRLRDLSYVKIFLIAMVWPAMTVLLPAIQLGLSSHGMVSLLLIEKFFFLLAITLPFDIRDLAIDQYNDVKTLPTILGVKKTIWLSELLLLPTLAIFLFFFNLDFISLPVLVSHFLSIILTGLIIGFTPKIRHDYYFTGLLDGTMILQPVMIFIGTTF